MKGKKTLINWIVIKLKTPALWQTIFKRRERKTTDWDEKFGKNID